MMVSRAPLDIPKKPEESAFGPASKPRGSSPGALTQAQMPILQVSWYKIKHGML
jgi:hypothetical protein